MFAGQMGAQLLSPDLKTAQLNTPEVVDAAKFWFDWVTTYKIANPASMTWKSANAVQAFSHGKVGMLIMVTPSNRRSFDNAPAVKNKYAFVPMPTIPYGMNQRPIGGMPMSTIVSGDMLAVASYSNMKDLAYKFISMLTDKPHQIAWYKIFGDLPTNVEATDELVQSDPQNAAFIQAEQGASPTPFSAVWGPLELALAGVSSELAGEVATNHYNSTHIKMYLDQANQQIQSKLH
jgi:multiple sugar transport system substrate-binding protein